LALLGNDKVLVVGHGHEHVFDLVSQTFTHRPAPLFLFGEAVGVPDGRVIFVDDDVVRETDGVYRTGPTSMAAERLIRLPNGQLMAETNRGVAEVSAEGMLSFVSSLDTVGPAEALDDDTLVKGSDNHALLRYAFRTGSSKPWPVPATVKYGMPRARVGEQLVFATLYDGLHDEPFPAWLDGKTTGTIMGARMSGSPELVESLGDGRALVMFKPKYTNEQRWVIARAPSIELVPSRANWPTDPVEASCHFDSGSVLLLTGPELFQASHAWLFHLEGDRESMTDLGGFATLQAPRCTAKDAHHALILSAPARLFAVDLDAKSITELKIASPLLSASGQLFTDESLMAYSHGNLFAIRNDDRLANLLFVTPLP
jgi:hypothetical protein